jgi:hypothetical protein
MSSPAQILANRENSTHSTGPATVTGKLASSVNARTHGLTGAFTLLAWEDAAEFQSLLDSLTSENKPETPTETRLIQSIAEHYWLMHRAIHLQNRLLESPALDHHTFSLYLRYQTTNERAYYRAMRELQTLRKEKRRVEIGFESQQQKQAEELRKNELNEARVRLANARAAESEIETEVRATMEAPIPGHARIPFSDMVNAFRVTLQNLNRDLAAQLQKQEAA